MYWGVVRRFKTMDYRQKIRLTTFVTYRFYTLLTPSFSLPSCLSSFCLCFLLLKWISGTLCYYWRPKAGKAERLVTSHKMHP